MMLWGVRQDEWRKMMTTVHSSRLLEDKMELIELIDRLLGDIMAVTEQMSMGIQEEHLSKQKTVFEGNSIPNISLLDYLKSTKLLIKEFVDTHIAQIVFTSQH